MSSQLSHGPLMVDSLQRRRILQDPASEFYLSTFHPGMLSHDLNPRNFEAQISYPKRILVEVNPETRMSTWTYVPPAHVENGVVHEGTWPRLIDLCGCVCEY